MLRGLVVERLDEVLFSYSYDYVGDLAETIALVWPGSRTRRRRRNCRRSCRRCTTASRSDGPRLVERWLDRLDASGRFALIKLVTGGLRVGVTARLAKQALARFGGKDVVEIEEIWHGLKPPYVEFFAWLEGRGERPVSAALSRRSARSCSRTRSRNREFEKLDPKDYAAEWKWDGIRVQAVSEKGVRRLYSRTGDDISGAFPDILEVLDFEGAIDGELLVGREEEGAIAVAPFGDLQQRLNRKTVSASSSKPIPPSSAPMISCRPATTTPVRFPSANVAGGWRISSRRSSRRASTSRRWWPSPTGRSSRGCGSIRRPTTASTRWPRG